MSPESRSPFADLRAALDAHSGSQVSETDVADAVRVDPSRWRRTGIPEVVYAEHKTPTDVVNALRRLAASQGRALASRVKPQDVAAITDALVGDLVVEDVQRPAA